MNKKVLAGCRHGDGGKEDSRWCQQCAAEKFKNRFREWTCNPSLNKIIQWSQKYSTAASDYLLFIKFDRLKDVKHFADGRYGSIYEALWVDGPEWIWDSSENIWKSETNMKVFKYVKLLTNGSLTDFFGITEDYLGNYLFVMRFYEDGNLYEYLEKNYDIISWRDNIDMLQSIAEGLYKIHVERKFHSNLHGGNILIEDKTTFVEARVSDVGLYGPADKQRSFTDNYGVLPFVAPEILRGEQPEEKEVCKFNQAADIYSFGIIMATISTGKKPYYDRDHNQDLVEDICSKDLRPKITKEMIPNLYYELMTKCWSSNPEERPSASELYNTFKKWTFALDEPDLSDIAIQFNEADDKKWKPTSDFI
ncbi:6625_t:CDS:2 [Acaulospora colombiana]|uniref:6625_t:CDS:1 n=1 Tax=Acaulospora colombiana TaxID=27376 RepID=A0ACA9NQU0_9GLOM|nr:6625_t:CDS:2 [Acaulospora colombiana]